MYNFCLVNFSFNLESIIIKNNCSSLVTIITVRLGVKFSPYLKRVNSTKKYL